MSATYVRRGNWVTILLKYHALIRDFHKFNLLGKNAFMYFSTFTFTPEMFSLLQIELNLLSRFYTGKLDVKIV